MIYSKASNLKKKYNPKKHRVFATAFTKEGDLAFKVRENNALDVSITQLPINDLVSHIESISWWVSFDVVADRLSRAPDALLMAKAVSEKHAAPLILEILTSRVNQKTRR